MANSRKNLRTVSIVVLAFSLIALVREVFSIFFKDFKMETLPEGATAGLVMATQIVLSVLMLILLIPDFYIGAKGLKVSKNPDSSKAHIVWATILAVLAGIRVISNLSALAQGDMISGLINVVLEVVDVAIYVVYIKFAKQVRKTV